MEASPSGRGRHDRDHRHFILSPLACERLALNIGAKNITLMFLGQIRIRIRFGEEGDEERIL